MTSILTNRKPQGYCPHQGGAAMPFYQRGPVRIHYQDR